MHTGLSDRTALIGSSSSTSLNCDTEWWVLGAVMKGEQTSSHMSGFDGGFSPVSLNLSWQNPISISI